MNTASSDILFLIASFLFDNKDYWNFCQCNKFIHQSIKHQMKHHREYYKGWLKEEYFIRNDKLHGEYKRYFTEENRIMEWSKWKNGILCAVKCYSVHRHGDYPLWRDNIYVDGMEYRNTKIQ